MLSVSVNPHAFSFTQSGTVPVSEGYYRVSNWLGAIWKFEGRG